VDHVTGPMEPAPLSPVPMTGQRRPLSDGLQKFGVLALGFGAFLGAFVFSEPAPYELYILAIMCVAFMLGLKVPRALLTPLICLTLFNLGGMIAMFHAYDFGDAALYVAVTAFLCLTTFFFACIVAQKPVFTSKIIFTGWMLGALLAAMIGIAGYFNVAGLQELATLYGRARGTFQDPNVFAPFLILPLIACIIHLLFSEHKLMAVFYIIVSLILVLGIFLSFSRGAWAHLIGSTAIATYLIFMLSHDAKIRGRIIVASLMGGIVLSGLFVAILSIPDIADLLSERASLVQDYDAGPTGRFGRQIQGFLLALDHPFGIGAKEFGKFYFNEDPHNTYLNALMAYGWLGFAAYVIFVLLTLIRLANVVLTQPALRTISIPVFATFSVLCLLGLIIDTDHWRHFFLETSA
jgi:O-antigen ligase